ncbi:hypothetical protein Scep_021398 [Stephania cephalantha]|uniref:Uncharacterized protein n=1 Tax=Stephania cephalantha TaxID=152367 RepID=A0AAP0F4A3_9MAGN
MNENIANVELSWLTLKKYEREVIDVEVHMLDYVDNNEEENDNENGNAEEGDDISIDSLIVKIADTSENADAYEGLKFS